METNEQQRDEALWQVAKKRAAFKRHFFTYVIINLFLWGIWFFTGSRTYDGGYIPWPAWVTLGWGVGVAFNYIDAYVANQRDAVQREYDKLKNQNK